MTWTDIKGKPMEKLIGKRILVMCVRKIAVGSFISTLISIWVTYSFVKGLSVGNISFKYLKGLAWKNINKLLNRIVSKKSQSFAEYTRSKEMNLILRS